jgi:MoxR-like ATPase
LDPHEKASKLLKALNQGLVEREEAMNIAFLSAVAGESVFLLGPPGVAKSLIARRLKFAFRDSQSFEYLMNRFSTPDEIFGPISIKKLKDEDKYERITAKYLPGSNVVFLDEIWKAGPSIQNALLTILNEKVYRNGEQEVKVKLRGIVSASNELPAKGQGLEALWDRFLFRVYVTGVGDIVHFRGMITDTSDPYLDNVPEDLKISEEELEKWSRSIDEVEVPEEVLSLIDYLRMAIEEQNKKTPETRLYVSDRRWKKIIRVMRASAFLNGRKKVDLMDCFLIAHCIWESQNQIDLVKELISTTIRQHGYSLNLKTELIEGKIKSFEEEVENEITVRTPLKLKKPVPVNGNYYEIMGYRRSGY